MAVTNQGLAGLYSEHQSVRDLVDNQSLSSPYVAVALTNAGHITSERAVRRLRARISAEGVRLTPNEIPPRLVDSQSVKGQMTLKNGGETGEFTDVILDEPIVNDDWSHVFEHFNLDPAKFYIVGDTVHMKMSKWEQSKRTDSGDRDVVQLSAYSYSAQFRRRSDEALDPEVIHRWRTNLIENPVGALHTTPYGAGTYTIFIADPQLGKKNTEEAVNNWQRGVKGHMAAIVALEQAGEPVERVHVAFMGDETEGVANNYTNQPHTIELNQTQQLELDFDMRMWTLREVLSLGYRTTGSSVISNHGEWTRNGSKDVVTTRNDNASTHIARQVKKAFDTLTPYAVPRIDWTIGDSAPGIVVNLSGVEVYMSHGYVEKGRGASTEIRTKNAIERQILGSTGDYGTVPLWFMAHYHHFYSQEFEGRTLFGLPALEADRSSEYMLHQYGVWSPSGSLGLVVGRDRARGWSNLNVF